MTVEDALGGGAPGAAYESACAEGGAVRLGGGSEGGEFKDVEDELKGQVDASGRGRRDRRCRGRAGSGDESNVYVVPGVLGHGLRGRSALCAATRSGGRTEEYKSKRPIAERCRDGEGGKEPGCRRSRIYVALQLWR